MGSLAVKLYDPAAAVTKATSALLAMTVLDTVNLRNTFTVPVNGRVLVHLRGCIHGATTFPQILLGVSTSAGVVVARKAPQMVLGGTALATTMVDVSAVFVVPALTPGASLIWDATYGVETIVAGTGIKYGGPNNALGNDAFGAFQFEVWEA